MATTTTHAEFIPELWASVALERFKKYTVMSALIPRFTDGEFARQGDVFHLPAIADLTVGTRTEGAPMTFEAGDASEQTITLNVWDYVAFTVTDLLEMQANQDIMGLKLDNAMMVLAEKIDRTLLGAYSQAGSNVGTGAVALTANSFLDLDKAFNDNSVPMGERTLVMGTKARREYLTLLTQAGISAVHPDADSAAANAEMPNVYGFRAFLDNQVINTLGPPVTDHNLAFHPSAIVLATRPLVLPEPGQGVEGGYASLDNLSIRVLRSFDHATTVNRISLDVLYGYKVLRPSAVIDVRN